MWATGFAAENVGDDVVHGTIEVEHSLSLSPHKSCHMRKSRRR